MRGSKGEGEGEGQFRRSHHHGAARGGGRVRVRIRRSHHGGQQGEGGGGVFQGLPTLARSSFIPCHIFITVILPFSSTLCLITLASATRMSIRSPPGMRSKRK